METLSYRASYDSNDVEISYAQESVWGTLPAVPFKELRYTGESLSGSKTRQRPPERNANREASAAVTMEETAAGGINFALSNATFDDILSGILCGEWTGTPASATLTNGRVFKSFHVQKKFSDTLFLRYPGVFFSAATLTLQRGQFLGGSLTTMAKSEDKATTNASTGSVTLAPSGRVMSPVVGVRNITLNGAPVGSGVQSITLNISNEGAAQDFALGSAAAQGMRSGNFTVSGTFEAFFRDFSLYDLYKNETGGLIAFETIDDTGAGYKFELLNATIMSPRLNAGGVNQPVMANFQLEASPQVGGGTLRITRITP